MPNENSWKNYVRIIEKYLICLSDIKNFKIDELDKNRIISRSELKKQLKISIKKLGAVNYVCRNLINDINILNGYENPLKNTIKILNLTIDKLELRVFEYLKVINYLLKISATKRKSITAELSEIFEEKLIKAYKLFSNFNIFLKFYL